MTTTKKAAVKKPIAKHKPKAKKPAGRPTLYSQDLANRICAELAGGLSLRSICLRDDMPNRSTVFAWLADNDKFSNQYARAKRESADALADDIQDITERTLEGIYEPAAARVAIDGKKWVASKLKPKKYGDKLELDNNVTHSLTDKSEDELNKLVEGYLKGVGGGKSS